jgi:hypothetical protein
MSLFLAELKPPKLIQKGFFATYYPLKEHFVDISRVRKNYEAMSFGMRLQLDIGSNSWISIMGETQWANPSSMFLIEIRDERKHTKSGWPLVFKLFDHAGRTDAHCVIDIFI